MLVERSNSGEISESIAGMTLDREFVVPNKRGLHARAAGRIVDVASKFRSEIWIVKDGSRVDGKSILDVLTLAAKQWSKVTIAAKGDDAAEALKALEDLFKRNFDET